MRHRNFSQVLGMQSLGYQYVEVVAILDNKTSPICRAMNGRRIPIETAVNYVGGDFAESKWEKPKDFTPDKIAGKDTAGIVENMSSVLPPYHANCRTTVVQGLPERVVNRKGRKFLWEKRNKPKFSYTENHRTRRAKDTIEQCTRECSLLGADEFAAKMNAARQAKWKEDLIEEKFDGHWREFDDIDFNDRNHEFKEYKKKTKAILDGNFDSVYIYKRRRHGRFMFYEEATSTGVFVDTNENMVVNMYRIRDKDKITYDDEYIRIDGK